MAVLNIYDFYGKSTIAVDSNIALLSPLVSETYVIKSILVTSAGTPSVTVTNNAFTAIKTAALTANTTVELLTQPLIVVGGTTLTIKAGSSDSFDFGVSYLNIKKEVTT